MVGEGCGGTSWGHTLSYCSLHRPFNHINQRYGPYVAGAYFILKQGGAVRYDGTSVRSGLGGGRGARTLRLS